MSTETIDQKIRDRASRELYNRLQKAKNDLCAAIHIQGTTDKITIKPLKGEPVEVYNRDLLDQIIDCAFEKIKPGEHERAINEFMRKVDSIQDEIDQLRDEIGG